LVIGTRPEAIKLAPVAHGLRGLGISPLLVFSGQHPPLKPGDFGLGRYEKVRLACPGQRRPHAHVQLVSRALAALLECRPAELVVVQGDTSTALGGALAARLAGVPVAHVEAGLRSHDRRRPWPEEEFRIAIDAQAELLFAPTDLSAANLRREGARGQIHVTGNSGIDAVLAVRAELDLRPRKRGLPTLLVTCHRRENWGFGISGVASAIRTLAAAGIAKVEVVLHPNPAVANQVRGLLADCPEIGFRPPAGHREMIAAMVGADLLLSDSGGIQEEAAALGIPLLVLRDRTERPEAIACGSFELVGTDPERILAAVKRRLRAAVAPAALPFGDGRAGERIAAIIAEWLEERAEAASSPAVTNARMSPGHPVRW
jgi:UDP-N-acetylglucosamine 2-epimerase (non-hydrolysing)